jgi:signal transduction histidine kinase
MDEERAFRIAVIVIGHVMWLSTAALRALRGARRHRVSERASWPIELYPVLVWLPLVLATFFFVGQVELDGRVQLGSVGLALAGSLFANYYFTPPFYRFTIAEVDNLVALLVFLGVAGLVSNFVVAAARRAAEAKRAKIGAQTLAGLAAIVGEDDPLGAVVGHLQSAFGLDAVAVLRSDGGHWVVDAAAGHPVPGRPEDATLVQELAPGTVLALVGEHIPAEDRFVLNAFSAQLGSVLERRRLRAEAGRAHVLAEANELRSALLQAVSHDLRTPSPRSRPPSPASHPTRSPGRRTRPTSSSPPSTRKPTVSPPWSPTSST